MSETGLITYQGGAILPVIDVKGALQRYQDMKEFVTGVLRQDVDFGKIPGTNKDTLLKPGAEKLCWFFGLKPAFAVTQSIEDWTGKDHDGEPFFYYRAECSLIRNGEVVASADGSCNSWEKKYRYRSADRVCPTCGQAAIFKSKNKPEFYCWNKKGGCGATFALTDKRITEQETGQIKNPDICDLPNTLLKMAEKRALVAATLIGANASEWFTQDMEDFVDGVVTEVTTTTTNPPPAPGNGKPAQAEKPWTSTVVTLETAKTTAGSDKKPYWGLPDDQLKFRLQSLKDTLEKGTLTKDHEVLLLTENERADRENRRDIIQAILDYRQ